MLRVLTAVTFQLSFCACGLIPEPSPPVLSWSELLSREGDPCARFAVGFGRAPERNPAASACLERRCQVWLDGRDPARPDDHAEISTHCDLALVEDDRTRVLPCAASACGRLVEVDPAFALSAAPAVAGGAARLGDENLWRSTGVYGGLVASDERLSAVLALARTRPCEEQAALLSALEPVMALRNQPEDGAETWAALTAFLGQESAFGEACIRVDDLALRLADRLDPGGTSDLAVRLWADRATGSDLFGLVGGLLQRRVEERISLPIAAAVKVRGACQGEPGPRQAGLCQRVAEWGLGQAPPQGAPSGGASPMLSDPTTGSGGEPDWLADIDIPASLFPETDDSCDALAPIEEEGHAGEACLQHLVQRRRDRLPSAADANRRFCLDQLCVRAVRSEPEILLDALVLLQRAPADLASQGLAEDLGRAAFYGNPGDRAPLFRIAAERPCDQVRLLFAAYEAPLFASGGMHGPGGDAALALVRHVGEDCSEVPMAGQTIDWLRAAAMPDARYAVLEVASGAAYGRALRAEALRLCGHEFVDQDGSRVARISSPEEYGTRMMATCARAVTGTMLAQICPSQADPGR
jgi:hypothetical protein